MTMIKYKTCICCFVQERFWFDRSQSTRSDSVKKAQLPAEHVQVDDGLTLGLLQHMTAMTAYCRCLHNPSHSGEDKQNEPFKKGIGHIQRNVKGPTKKIKQVVSMNVEYRIYRDH